MEIRMPVAFLHEREAWHERGRRAEVRTQWMYLRKVKLQIQLIIDGQRADSKTPFEGDPFVGYPVVSDVKGFAYNYYMYLIRSKNGRDLHIQTKPTRIYSAQRWAQGHCRQDAAALPETMPTPVRHEARAVTSRVRSHLLLTSAGVAVTVHEEADNGEGIAVIELDGMSKSADREKSLPWCQDAARVAQQPNTVPTSVWHRPQHLLGHIAEGRYSDERRALLQGRAQSHLLLASTGGAVTVGVHGSWSKLGETSSTPPMTQRVDGDKEPPQGAPESGGNLGRGALLTTIEMVFRKRRQKHRHNGRTFKYRKRGAATNDDRPEKG
ncbi:hypothetical protein C8R46DRAFT_1035802 [Mycena filopes]|nr:hypothetical protein C8R46DRAFT_1035802 [Mycena filopes]